MAEFSEWVRNLKDWRLVAGFLSTIAAGIFAAGVTFAGIVSKPSEISQNTLKNAMQDTAIVQIRETSAENQRLLERIFCVVRLMAEDDGPVNPLACEDGGGS